MKKKLGAAKSSPWRAISSKAPAAARSLWKKGWRQCSVTTAAVATARRTCSPGLNMGSSQ